MQTQFKTLVSLNESELTTKEAAQDIRNRDVYDPGGEKVGHVKDLLIDEDGDQVRFFEVAHGGFLGLGEERIIVPVDVISSIEEDGVHIDRDRDIVARSPAYDPELARKAEYYDTLYGHYGIMPYWSAAYRYPAYPFI